MLTATWDTWSVPLTSDAALEGEWSIMALLSCHSALCGYLSYPRRSQKRLHT